MQKKHNQKNKQGLNINDLEKSGVGGFEPKTPAITAKKIFYRLIIIFFCWYNLNWECRECNLNSVWLIKLNKYFFRPKPLQKKRGVLVEKNILDAVN